MMSHQVVYLTDEKGAKMGSQLVSPRQHSSTLTPHEEHCPWPCTHTIGAT